MDEVIDEEKVADKKKEKVPDGCRASERAAVTATTDIEEVKPPCGQRSEAPGGADVQPAGKHDSPARLRRRFVIR